MKIQAAPLLYARTFHVDFRSGLLIRPDDFEQAETDKIYTIIKSATSFFDLDRFTGRDIVIGNGRHVVAGRVVVFENLFTEAGLTPEYCYVDHDDGKPRNAWGFVGVVVKVPDSLPVFDADAGVLASVYRSAIRDRWEEILSDETPITTHRPYEEIEVRSCAEECTTVVEQAVRILRGLKDKATADASPSKNRTWQLAAMQMALAGERISICTNVTMPKVIQEIKVMLATSANASAMKKTAAKEREQTPEQENAQPLHKMEKTPYEPQKAPVKSSFDLLGKRLGFGEKKELKNEAVNEIVPGKKGGSESLDDFLERLHREDNDQNDGGTVSKSEIEKQLKKLGIDDFFYILGTIGGLTYVVIGSVFAANPKVLILSGAVSTILAGVEAKRLIAKFRKDE